MNQPALDLILPFPEWVEQVNAGFTARVGGLSSGAYSQLNLGFRCGDNADIVEQNWEVLRSQTGLIGKPLVLPKMVHSDRIVDVDKLTSGDSRIEPDETDAIYSRKPDRILAVTMADCLTALIYDPYLKTIAAVHAGWRGTRLGILGKTLNHLTKQGFINPKNTCVAFGPCLRPDSLEMGEEVAAQLNADFINRKNGKCYFDMPASNRSQAMAEGILPENLRDMGGCTLQNPARYFSYRRDGKASGRLAAFISLL